MEILTQSPYPEATWHCGNQATLVFEFLFSDNVVPVRWSDVLRRKGTYFPGTQKRERVAFGLLEFLTIRGEGTQQIWALPVNIQLGLRILHRLPEYSDTWSQDERRKVTLLMQVALQDPPLGGWESVSVCNYLRERQGGESPPLDRSSPQIDRSPGKD